MKTMMSILLMAGLFAFSAHTFAQETDTALYQGNDTYDQARDNTSFDDPYNTDTTGYNTDTTGYRIDDMSPEREQQGDDTYNETENDTRYNDPNEGLNDDPGTGVDNPKNDQDEFPEEPEGEMNQESGTSIHDKEDPLYRQGQDANKLMKDADDTADSLRPGNTGSDHAAVPESDSVHQQVQKEFQYAADTLESASQQSPDRAGRRAEQAADTADAKLQRREKEQYDITE